MSESQDILLAQWLSGEIKEADLKKLELTYDLDYLHNTLKRQNNYLPETVSSEELWNNIEIEKNKHPHKSTSNRRNLIIGLIALLLATLIIYFLAESPESKIETNYEAKTTKIFADGSEVLIGPNSTIEYSDEEWTQTRKIQLNGQAFFKVNKGVPFTVNTKAGNVEVLGTQFDVWCIDNKYMRVTCSEGKVRVIDKNGQSRTITASQYVYITDGNIGKTESSDNSIIDWTSNFRNYKRTPIKVLFADMERFYNTSFIAESDISDDVFTGILPTDDLAKCIRFIESSLLYESNESKNKVEFRKAD